MPARKDSCFAKFPKSARFLSPLGPIKNEVQSFVEVMCSTGLVAWNPQLDFPASAFKMVDARSMTVMIASLHRLKKDAQMPKIASMSSCVCPTIRKETVTCTVNAQGIVNGHLFEMALSHEPGTVAHKGFILIVPNRTVYLHVHIMLDWSGMSGTWMKSTVGQYACLWGSCASLPSTRAEQSGAVHNHAGYAR